MSTPTRRPRQSDTECPSWCHAVHSPTRNHTQLTGVVLRDAHNSIAVEIEQSRSGRPPRIVVSVFAQEVPKAMSATLTVDEAERAMVALAEALRLVGETPTFRAC